MDLNTLDLKALKKLEAEVRNRIATYEDRKMAEARAELEAKAKELGFSLSALVGGGAAKGRKATSSVAPKYAHPENPSMTWSGRGRKPKWVEAALAEGKSLDDLAI